LCFYLIIEINEVRPGFVFGFHRKRPGEASHIVSDNKVASATTGRGDSTGESKVNVDFLKRTGRALGYTAWVIVDSLSVDTVLA
jgi:hypothetical protein